MLTFIKKKIERHRLKRTFKEYGFEIKQFNLSTDGKVEYAQWLHPFEQPKIMEQSNVDFFKQFVKKGDLIIDIGAHTGDTSVPMSLAAGKEGCVLALEPNIYVYKILTENAKLNTSKTNIVPLNFAVTDNDGSFTFNYSDASFCNGGFLSKIKSKKHRHTFTLQVEGKNLEKFVQKQYSEIIPKLSLIKIDTEGYDKEILKSIKNIIIKYKPYIITECYKHLNREERFEFFEIIKELKYDLYHLDDFEKHDKINISTKEDMMKWKHFDMILIPQK